MLFELLHRTLEIMRIKGKAAAHESKSRRADDAAADACAGLRQLAAIAVNAPGMASVRIKNLCGNKADIADAPQRTRAAKLAQRCQRPLPQIGSL